jgi:type II secretory pathway pseudopilin PulG
VAIIAILAAIAVPNFLEAQVRSKVSRVKADMRSFATGLEAYRTDHNKYPSHHYTLYEYRSDPLPPSAEFFIGGVLTAPAWTESNPFPGPYHLTTPVVYLTTLPQDGFHIPEGDDPYDTTLFLYTNFEDYCPYIHDNRYLLWYGSWRMTSAGPDKSRRDGYTRLYDPTNGTVSWGQIHRTQLSPEGIPINPDW